MTSKGDTPESLAGVRVVAHAAPQLALKHVSAVTNEAGHLLLDSHELGVQALHCGTRVTLHQIAKRVKTLKRTCSSFWYQVGKAMYSWVCAVRQQARTHKTLAETLMSGICKDGPWVLWPRGLGLRNDGE